MSQMDDTIAPPAPAAAQRARASAWLVVLVALGLLWWELINQLKGEWWLNAQYN